ncbi:MAG: hypothetical protein ABWY31_05275, partial [Pseudoxanthomonas sp.]
FDSLPGHHFGVPKCVEYKGLREYRRPFLFAPRNRRSLKAGGQIALPSAYPAARAQLTSQNPTQQTMAGEWRPFDVTDSARFVLACALECGDWNVL